MWAMNNEFAGRKNCTKSAMAGSGSGSQMPRRVPKGQTFAQEKNQSLRARGHDKDLTPLAGSCDNILRKFEDYMARQNGRGSSRPRASIRTATLLNQFTAKFCSRRTLLSLVGLVLLPLVIGGMSLGQTSDVDDIHVSPRLTPATVDTNPIPNELRGRTLVRSKVNLVLVPVTVTDPMNRLVTGLDKENFQVFEGKEQQEVRNFSSEDAPVSLGVIFDMSGSMSSKIERAREAVIEFFKTANPQDEFFLITFADKPEEISDFTQSIDDLQGKLVFTVPKGRTALLDAIYLGLSKMRDAKYPKKALLIISDGGDNHSRYTEGEIKGLVKEADVMIYSIGIYDHYFQTEEERLGPALLSDISDLSGGRAFTIDNPNDLADVATKIGIELRNQYVLGYRPKNPGHDGKWHKIKVKLLPPKGLPPLHVYARTGYYASSQ
jgi:Ca-activated chloride channel family protein